ncbi:DUF2797 domain-containing protein [Halostella sp. JP-L12]|uniref:DUF2797 domain-containing protein n=1 Tax=Halostella TaxID=1843185 RepID=UPI000EF77A19|nr:MULTISPECIES: DUF2797 domain-containing protein [Halostella]NHN47338.1 DUF2797 domain-containing protein [Halostella sp. JP-L12]
MQIVGYDTGAPDDEGGDGRAPALLVAADGVVERAELTPGTRLAYSLGERRCAGAVDGTTHYACGNEGAPYCDQHASTWVCARCTGTCLKDEMDCYEEHAVYLAAFAPATVKVGVTRLWRLETRLREQGADRAAHVHTVSNGRIARELEAEIATDLTDRVRVPEKIAGLHSAVDEDVWEVVLDDFDVIDRTAFDYGIDLDSRPVVETLASGEVVGVKGRILVLSNAGTTYAVDLRDLVGHEVAEEAADRNLQSDLGAFY